MAPKSKKSQTSSSAAPALAQLRPSEIWYTFGKIRDTFSGCGRALETTLKEIQAGELAVGDLPPIAVITHDVDIARGEGESSESEDGGRRRKASSRSARRSSASAATTTVRRYYSMNNRRLWVLKACEASGALASMGGTVGVRMESRESCARLLRKGSRNFRLDRCTPGPVKLISAPEPTKTTCEAGAADKDESHS